MNLAALANIPFSAKIGAGAIAGLALLGGSAAVGAHFAGSAVPASATNVPIVATPVPAPSTSPRTANAAAQATRRAELQAEAKVLGISLKQLAADFKAGQTVQQLATQKNLSQDQFRMQMQQDLKPLLDQDVTAGTLTAAQEQRAIQRLATVIPNWSQVGAAKKPSPSASPTA